MANTLKEIAIAMSQKQEHFVNNLTEEAPILDTMHFEPSSHGLWNAYEEVSKIKGAEFVEINQPLPEMEVDSDLKKVDLSIIGGEIFLPEDKAVVLGTGRFFQQKTAILLKHAGQTTEKKIIYDSFLPYALSNGKAADAKGTENCYSMVTVRFIEGEVTGLYAKRQTEEGASMIDSVPINGNQLYKNADGLLGYGMRLKGYIGVQLANPDAVSAIVNITPENIPTAEAIDNMLIEAKASPLNTFIYCHPKVLSLLNKYKGNVLQTAGWEKDLNRGFMAWNGIRFVTSYNFENGSEQAVKIA
jgi:hypothetical protein